MLWFDVGSERYTTQGGDRSFHRPLWFDVGSERYTTEKALSPVEVSCGLM